MGKNKEVDNRNDELAKAVYRVIKNAKKLINHKDKDNIIITETIKELKPKIEEVYLIVDVEGDSFENQINEKINAGWIPLFDTFKIDGDWYYIFMAKYKVKK